DVRAMPLVLHIPKLAPPARSDLLAAAASATLQVCLDERVADGGPWHDEYTAWLGARIRKVSRRARGAQWAAALEVPGVTVDVNGASACAYVPCRVGDLDRRLRKLQVGGTDLEADDPGPHRAGAVRLWVDGSLEMTVGKTAAQVGHAVMLAAGAMTAEQVTAWYDAGWATSVRDADESIWAELTAACERGAAVGVRDAGFTEVAPGSTTVIADLSPLCETDRTDQLQT
ncbi:MAG: aminoacyl-tRNA hydrolase, partial [Rhodococcus sp. (in: high G+C Gram-positive bacteria)]